MPTISVIVPIYKVEDYLADCIDSILAQTFKDFELILVDDGSPDNCGKICDEYKEKDDRIVVIHKDNGGLSDARNKGIDISKGEYLTFVDSDDLIHINYLSALYHSIIKYEANISICSLEEFRNCDPCSLDSDDKNDVVHYLSGKDACVHLYAMDGLISVNACGKLYLADLFKELRFPFGKINEDQGTVPIALYKASKIVIISQQYYKYRVRHDSIMHNIFNSRRFDDLFCTQICIDFYHNHNEAELVELATKYKQVLQAKLIVDAISLNKREVIPLNYNISERKALRILRLYCSDDRYCWHLAKLHPNWLLPHAYWRKFKKTIGIKCN